MVMIAPFYTRHRSSEQIRAIAVSVMHLISMASLDFKSVIHFI